MKKTVTAITFFDIVFLFVLSVSGSIDGIIGDIIYYFAFIVPVFLAFLYLKSNKDEESKPVLLKVLPNKKSIGYSLPLVAPFIAIVFIISFLTSLLLTKLGFSETTDVSGNLFSVIIRHAVLPAFLEEALFRFVPLVLLIPYSKKNALAVTSIMFAAVHCSLFQIPYALAASFMLSLLALATESVFPCFLIHFLNNVVSILFMRYSGAPLFNTIFFSALGAITVISVAVIFLKREKYKEVFTDLKEDKCNVEFTFATIMFVAMALVIGVVNLWMSL